MQMRRECSATILVTFTLHIATPKVNNRGKIYIGMVWNSSRVCRTGDGNADQRPMWLSGFGFWFPAFFPFNGMTLGQKSDIHLERQNAMISLCRDLETIRAAGYDTWNSNP
jgi:hypothetical protein